jgi:hypothetical protein
MNFIIGECKRCGGIIIFEKGKSIVEYTKEAYCPTCYVGVIKIKDMVDIDHLCAKIMEMKADSTAVKILHKGSGESGDTH